MVHENPKEVKVFQGEVNDLVTYCVVNNQLIWLRRWSPPSNVESDCQGPKLIQPEPMKVPEGIKGFPIRIIPIVMIFGLESKTIGKACNYSGKYDDDMTD